jgi:hypothetical protein
MATAMALGFGKANKPLVGAKAGALLLRSILSFRPTSPKYVVPEFISQETRGKARDKTKLDQVFVLRKTMGIVVVAGRPARDKGDEIPSPHGALQPRPYHIC